MTASKLISLKGALSIALLSAPVLLVVATDVFAQEATPSTAISTTSSSSISLEARTLIKASRRVSYRTEIAAPILTADFDLGQAFEKGDKLIALDCRKYEAERKGAEASARAANIEFDTQTRLHKYNAVGKNEVDLAQANADQAAAQAEVHAVQADYCAFTAPFNGRVVELNVRPFEYPPADKPLIVVIDDTQLEMELVVPSNWLNWLQVGLDFDVEVDDVNSKARGVVKQIGAEVDPVSRTVRVIAEFEQQPETVLAGMSGTVTFEQTVTN